MITKKQIREPKQLRSKHMKDKILETGLALFCKKGFYNTTTNDIAKTAGVSIGSLYSYFKNKEALLFEILDRYHKQFVALLEESINTIYVNKMDKKEWLYNYVESLIEIHKRSKDFNRELNALYYSNPKVGDIIDKQNEEMLQIIMTNLSLWKDDIKIEDLETAAIVSFDFISAIVHRIVFGKKTNSREVILRAGVNALFKYLVP